MTMTLKVQISVRIAIETLKALDTYCESLHRCKERIRRTVFFPGGSIDTVRYCV